MTKKLIHIILSSWLLFSSLYLSAHAETASTKQDTPTKPLVKKSAQAQFVEGVACMEQSNTACVKLALALIPSMSPYAKILQGALAQQNNQTEQALLILLPLQSDENLTLPAKIMLHRTLAQAFANLGDMQQAVQHFISTENLLKLNQATDQAEIKNIDKQVAANQEQIWKLLHAQTQTDLIALRGNNTDSVFQGWIDLTLASLHANSKLQVAEWRSIYPDHPAQTFAKKLAEDTSDVSQADTQPDLTIPSGVIALVLSTQDEAESESLQAFKLGLQTMLNAANSNASIEVYYQDQTPPEIIAAANYLIAPEFKSAALDSHDANIADQPTLHVRLSIQDEANTILSFIRRHNMQYATIVTTQHQASQPMLSAVQHAWSEYIEQSGLGAPNIIRLDADIMAQPVKLLDLKSQIASQLHDIVILAMPAEDVLKIRPYLDISVPTMTFSAIHDIALENDTLKRLNALRFVDIPFLLDSHHESDQYVKSASTLQHKHLLRWFALGADSLKLVQAIGKNVQQTLLIKGLAGNYQLSEPGEPVRKFTRSLGTARFSHSGIVAD